MNFKLLFSSIAILLVGLVISCSDSDDDVKVEVKSILLEATELAIKVGETETIKYSILPTNAIVTVSWSSENSAIATVNDKGEVTGIKAGETNIKLSAGSKTASCKVVVIDGEMAVESVTLNKTEMSVTEGDEFQLVAKILPELASNKKVSWTSDNEDVAVVDQSGKVVTKTPGEVTITVTTEDGEKTATCAVIVNERELTATAFEDDFNRDDTELFGVDNPKGLGENWTIISGLHGIQNQGLISRDQPGDALGSLVLFTAEGSNTISESDKFEASVDLSHGTFAGIVFNASEDGKFFYVLRITPESNLVQWLAIKDGGVQVVAHEEVKKVEKTISYETYRMTVVSEQPGKFNVKMTDDSGLIGEYNLVDDTDQGNRTFGYFGLWSILDPAYDNFKLTVKK